MFLHVFTHETDQGHQTAITISENSIEFDESDTTQTINAYKCILQEMSEKS